MGDKFCPHCLATVKKVQNTCPYCGEDLHYKSPPYHLPVGVVLSGAHLYCIGASLGQGGFGITYVARDEETGKKVCIKEYYPTNCATRGEENKIVVYSGLETTFETGKKNFLREAQMLAQLRDLSSIVQVLDFFKANGTAYLVMEYLEGRTLRKVVKDEGALEAQAFLTQIRPLMKDIARMHERSVIHRDIAPDNIICLSDGTLKLIDFGSARSYLGDASMSVVVKQGFAPVEQFLHHGQGSYTDVYALAATIYFCITGVVPPESSERQMSDEPIIVAPSKYGASLTKEQESALENAMVVEPKLRTQNMWLFMDGLFANEVQSKETGFSYVDKLTPIPDPNIPSVIDTEEKEEISPEVAPQSTESPQEPVHAPSSSKKEFWWIAAAGGIIVLAVLVFLSLSGKGKVDTSSPEDILWRVENETLILSGTGDMISYSPDAPAPWQSSYFTTVLVEDGVTGIGDYAFINNRALTKVSFSESVTKIGERAFSGCTTLSDVKLPTNLLVLSPWAFEDCASLRSLFVPGSLSEIGEGAFQRCSGLQSVNIEENVLSVGVSAFVGCQSLYEVHLPSTLMRLCDAAFCDCDSLEGIELPMGLETIEGHVFMDCDALTFIDIPETVKSIDECAFADCSSLGDVYFREGLEYIGQEAFRNDTNMKTVALPDSLIEIGDRAFQGCTNVFQLIISNNLQKVGQYALTSVCNGESNANARIWFSGTAEEMQRMYDLFQVRCVMIPFSRENRCGERMYFTVTNESDFMEFTIFGMWDMWDFENPQDCPFAGWLDQYDNVEVRGEVHSIGGNAFKNNPNLCRITFCENEYVSIHPHAFAGCENLSTVNFAGDTYLAEGAFENCVNIHDISFPIWSSLEDSVFKGCKGLQYVTFVGTMESMGRDAFANCTALEWVQFHSEARTFNDRAFYNCENLNDFTVIIDNSVQCFGVDMFFNCQALTNFRIPYNLPRIPRGCFRNCSNLNYVFIPHQVKIIEDDSFAGCDALETVELEWGHDQVQGTHRGAYCGERFLELFQ